MVHCVGLNVDCTHIVIACMSGPSLLVYEKVEAVIWQLQIETNVFISLIKLAIIPPYLIFQTKNWCTFSR